MDNHDRLVKLQPLRTEKSYTLEGEGCYVFEVNPVAMTKTAIKESIQRLFDVKVDRVATARRTKSVSNRKVHKSKRQKVVSKIAYVYLAEGQTINMSHKALSGE